MSLVMFYQTKVKPDSVDRLSELRRKFAKLYEKYGVEIIGHWRSANDPAENFYMARYENEEDYTKKVLRMHEDQEYRKLSAQLNEIRIDFQAKRLTPE